MAELISIESAVTVEEVSTHLASNDYEALEEVSSDSGSASHDGSSASHNGSSASHDGGSNDLVTEKKKRKAQRDTGLPPIYATSYSSYEEVVKAVEIHEITTSTEYINRNKAIVDGDIAAIDEAVRCEFRRANIPVYVRNYTVPRIHPRIKIDNPDLIPFIILGHCSKLCRHSSRRLPKTTINQTGCESIIKILQVVFFPQYQDACTSYLVLQHVTTSLLDKSGPNLIPRIVEYFIWDEATLNKVLLDESDYHKTAVDKLRHDLLNNLSVDMNMTWYMAIKDIHTGHPTGEGALTALRPDSRIAPQIEKLVLQKIFGYREIQGHLRSFVEGLIAAGTIPRPDPSCTRFYPTRSSIHGSIRSFRIKHEKLGNLEPYITLEITDEDIKTARRAGTLSYAKLSRQYQNWAQNRKCHHSIRPPTATRRRTLPSMRSPAAPDESKPWEKEPAFAISEERTDSILKPWEDEQTFTLSKRGTAEGATEEMVSSEVEKERRDCKIHLSELSQLLNKCENATVLKSLNQSVVALKSFVKLYEHQS